MMALQFLAEWALRSSILILGGALLLALLRVKDPAVRLAAWTAMLGASLSIPALTVVLPKLPLAAMPTPASESPKGPSRSAAGIVGITMPRVSATHLPPAAPDTGANHRFDWAGAAVAAYLLVSCGMLLRLAAGLAMSRRLLRASRLTGKTPDGIEVRESPAVTAPVTMGIVRAAIVLPADWREWDQAKLDAVLAHERSHVRRRDPAVQLVSAIHRSLVWHNPFSWFLDRRLVRTAEEASDDAAVAATHDRVSYAEVLLHFVQRGVRTPRWQGVAMARYERPDHRIHRILDGTVLSRGVTPWSMAALLALGAPLAYMAAAASPQPAPARVPQRVISTAPVAAQAAAATQASPMAQAPAAARRTVQHYVIVMGDGAMSGSWNSSDSDNPEQLRARFGRNFAWFRQGANEYLVTDAGVLAELDKAMAPQKEVNRMQGQVNDQQAVVNGMQAKVNSLQGEVNTFQDKVNKRQDLVNRIQAAVNKGDDDQLIQRLEAMLQELRADKGKVDQDSINHRQSDVNAEQAKVNAEQAKVNEQQQRVNAEQRRVSGEMNQHIDEILNSAVRGGRVQRLM